MRLGTLITALAGTACCLGAARSGEPAAQPAPKLELREIVKERVAQAGRELPADALQVFTYEGQPASVSVTAKHIAAGYERSGVLFDRTTGAVARRFTALDGWPARRWEGFGPEPARREPPMLIGPGVLLHWRDFDEKLPEREVAVSIEFAGRTWQATQPGGFLGGIDKLGWTPDRGKVDTWTAVLRRLSESSWLEAAAKGDAPAARFTGENGLAGNIVTALAVADGSLWAVCADIWDSKAGKWGQGGLCRYRPAEGARGSDPAAGKWERVEKIDGRPVRWVTLLQTVGDELWVGFREGEGVEGDSIAYGMGLYPDEYRPKTSAVVLARLAGGKWTSFARGPVSQAGSPHVQVRLGNDQKPPSPTEKPWSLTISGDRAILFSRSFVRAFGNWGAMHYTGTLSLVDLKTGEWRLFETEKDLGADELLEMTARDGEVLVTANLGLRRWDQASGSWKVLDPGGALRNPAMSALVPVGREVWVGYTNQSFGVRGGQGVSRYDERTGKWTHVAPAEIGTACPVRSIVAMPDGDVWVLFQPRPWMGAAMEYPFYRRESAERPKQGLGRFSGGKWEFPVKLEGIPEKVQDERQGPNGTERWDTPTQVDGLACAGGRLFVSVAGAGLYSGPGEWKKVLDYAGYRSPYWGPRSVGLRPSADGKTLMVGRTVAGSNRDHQEIGTLDPATGKSTFVAVDPSKEEFGHVWRSYEGLLDGLHTMKFRSDWVLLSETPGGGWVLGPLSSECHAVVVTPEAYWIASRGELLRLDRAKVKGLLGE